MSVSPEVSIIIPVHNEGELLAQTLDALAASAEIAMEIIVVDDGSTDGCCEPLQDASRRWDDVRLISRERAGVASARNLGATDARAPILIFLDGHCFPEPGWLQGLLTELDGHADSIVAPCIATSTTPVNRGYGLTLTDRGFSYRWLPRQATSPYEIPIAGGGCMAIRREYFDAIGRFDSMRFFGKEDVEICLRCWLLGGSVRVVPTSEVAHVFKKKFNYTVVWEDVTYNALRTAVLHFDGPRLARLIEFLETRPAYQQAVRELILSDIWERRAFVDARRTRNADWFCEHFAIDL